MKLADLRQVTELQGALERLDEIPIGVAILQVGDLDVTLGADEIAAFVRWRREGIYRELRAIDPELAPNDGEAVTVRIIEFTGAPAPVAPVVAANPARREVAAISTASETPPPSRREAREKATEQVMGAVYRDWKAGRLDDPGKEDPVAAGNQELARRAERCRAQIDEAAAALMNPTPPALCHCGAPATTRIGGGDYCDGHALMMPRLVRPAREAA